MLRWTQILQPMGHALVPTNCIKMMCVGANGDCPVLSLNVVTLIDLGSGLVPAHRQNTILKPFHYTTNKYTEETKCTKAGNTSSTKCVLRHCVCTTSGSLYVAPWS